MKKEIIKSIVNIVFSTITSLLAVFGLYGCSGAKYQCDGNVCFKIVKE